MRRLLRKIAIFLLAGAVLSLVIALAAVVFGDVAATQPQTFRVYDGRVAWNVEIWRTRWAQRYRSLRTAGLAWSEEQAAGAPDTVRQGDEQTAWASAAQDNQVEWLELEYRQPIRPMAIHIYESYNPGAVTKVTLFGQDGREHVAWEGKDPATTRPTVAVAKLPLAADVATQRAKIYIDSPAVSGWNEIDAVGLLDASGTVHWARRVRASSVYASGREPVTGKYLPQVPRWTGLSQPMPAFADDQVKRESRIVDGYGWPMVALRADRADLTTFTLPTRLVWSGLAINTAALAIILAAGRWLLTRPIYFLTEAARARRGCCIRCGYDLQFNLAAGCPECGWRRA